jgi:hypothetical protein
MAILRSESHQLTTMCFFDPPLDIEPEKLVAILATMVHAKIMISDSRLRDLKWTRHEPREFHPANARQSTLLIQCSNESMDRRQKNATEEWVDTFVRGNKGTFDRWVFHYDHLDLYEFVERLVRERL